MSIHMNVERDDPASCENHRNRRTRLEGSFLDTKTYLCGDSRIAG